LKEAHRKLKRATLSVSQANKVRSTFLDRVNRLTNAIYVEKLREHVGGQVVQRWRQRGRWAWLNSHVGTLVEVRRTRALVRYGEREITEPIEGLVIAADAGNVDRQIEMALS
jgi:hypothetical protein